MERDPRQARQVRTALSFLALTIAYAALSYIGLGWAQVRGAGSPVWPAAGAGLAGLMLGGVRLWPAIVIGRLVAAALAGSGQPLWADVAIAAGNALAAAIPALALARTGRWEETLDSLRGFLRFCLFGALGQALIAGSLGTAVLVLSSGPEALPALEVFSNWSIGVFVGTMTVGPLILAWSVRGEAWTARRIAGFAALIAATAGLAWLIFTSTSNESLRTWHILPLLIIASLTFSMRGTSAALLIMASIAVWGTSRGIGPFNLMANSSGQQVLLMQQFVGTMALTTLILSVVTEERRAQDVLAAEQEYLRRAEQESRARAEELEAILSAVPAAVMIAHDPECREMSTNRFGADALRQADWTDSIASLNPKVQMLDRSGRPLHEDERPMRRAARGETVSDFQGKAVFPDGMVRDLAGAARPLYDAKGAVRGAVGAFLDMTARMKAEERITLLALEVDHRAKNIMAVVQAMVRLTTAPDMDSFRKAITGRIGTLARTHNLLAANRWEGVSMQALVRDEFAAHGLVGEDHGPGGRLRACGPDLRLPPAAAQSLALVIHELITNAMKYGALSETGGWVGLAWSLAEEAGAQAETERETETRARILRVEWTEEGGPPVTPPQTAGFGTGLIANSIRHQLGGTVEIDWRPAGLRVALAVPLDG